MAFHPAKPGQRWQALSIILASNGEPANDQQVEDFLTFIRARSFNLDDLWVAEQNDSIVWAIFPVVSPGGTMLILGPDGAFAPPPFLGNFLDEIGSVFTTRGVQLTQVLLNPEDQASVQLYLGHQFEIIAELVYLHRQFRKTMEKPELPDDVELLTYGPETHARFAALITATYTESLDCPVLNGKRAIDDVLAGHKATGLFDPNLWFLLSRRGQDAAVLLLSRTNDGEGMELVYLGLTPHVRGQGIGDFLMKWAAYQTTRANCIRLALAVDSKNAPAMKLYFRHGMQRLGSKVAMMRELVESE